MSITTSNNFKSTDESIVENRDSLKNDSKNFQSNRGSPSYNEFSIFNNEELEELKLSNDDSKIYNYLINNYKQIDNVKNYMNNFYPKGMEKTEKLNLNDFYFVGVFEDLSYYQIWMSNKTLSKTITEFKEKYDIFYWRRIKGDGNCYYRSILISYIEIIISLSIHKNDPSYFFSLIKEILFTNFLIKKNFHHILITVLLFTYEQIKEKSIYAFDIFYRAINKFECIEKCLIFWLKMKLSEFLKKNINLEINGLKLIHTIPEINNETEEEINNYINNKLLKMDEYVDGYPIYITPFILKCQINIYSLNKSLDKNNNNSEIMNINKEIIPFKKNLNYVSVNNYLPILDKDQEINLLFKSPHYDLLNTKKNVKDIDDIYKNQNIILAEGRLNEKEYDNYKTSIVERYNEKKIKKENNEKKDNKENEYNENEFLLIKKKQYMELYNKERNNNINRNITVSKKNAIQNVENLEKLKREYNGSKIYNSAMVIKFHNRSKRCPKCSDIMTLKISCGCLICCQCSKKKIKNFAKNYNDIKIPISVCACGYILNDKEKKMIIQK